jgi:GAF domain-containing protein
LECGRPFEGGISASGFPASYGDLQRALSEALDRETATSAILRVISQSPTEVQPVFEAIVRSGAALCHAPDVIILIADSGSLRIAASVGPVAASVRQSQVLQDGGLPMTRGSVSGRAFIDRRTVHVHDVGAMPDDEFPEGKVLQREYGGLGTTLSVPLLHNDVSLGAITMLRNEVRPFTDRQVALLETFANQAAIAIENVRLFTELQEKNHALTQAHAQVTEALDQQTATSEILRVIASSPTGIEPVFAAIVRSATTLCEADLSGLYPFDGNLIHFGAQHGRTPDEIAAARRAFPQPPSRLSVTARAILDATVVQVADVSEDPEVADPLRIYRTVLSVPMIRDDRPIGAITVARRVVSPFTNKQIELLKTFADQAVIAIENVRLFKELEARNRDLTETLEQQTATSEILQVISSSPTQIRPVFDAIADNAARLCAAEDVSILEEDGGVFRVVAYRGASQLRDFEGTPVRRDSVAGRALLDGRLIHVHDILEESEAEYRVSKTFAQQVGHRTMLATPMVCGSSSIGVIFVRRTEVRPFSERQIALLHTFADQAVIAIENVRLFSELQEKNRALTEAHAQVTESLEQQTATSEVLRVIASSPTGLQPVFDTIARSSVRLCGAFDVSIFRVDADRLAFVAHHGPIAQRHAGFSLALVRGTVGGRSVLESRTVQVADLQNEDREFPDAVENARRFGFRTILSVPLLREGIAIGGIQLRRTEVQLFTEKQIALLQTFADQAVVAIENVRLFTELQEKNRALTQAHAQVTEALEQQTATSEVLHVISQSHTEVQPVFDAIAESAMRLFDAWSVGVYRFDGGLVNVAALRGGRPDSEAYLRQRYPMRPRATTGSVAVRAIVERRLQHIPDLERHENPEVVAVGRARGYRAALAAAMMRHGEPIGSIAVTRTRPGPFSDAQIELLKTFADQAVIAIENVRLFTELQEKNEALTRAHAQMSEALDQQTATSEILRTIAHAQTDVQPVFDTIVRSAARLCHAAVAGVFQTDGRMVYLPANYGTSPETLAINRARFPQPLDMNTTAGMAILTRSVVHVPDTEEPSAVEYARQTGRLLGFRSMVTVPMLREGETVGAITVTRQEPGRFSDVEVELLKTFADQAVIAIENVRLFKALEERTEELTRSVGQLTALGEVGRAVSSTLDLRTVLSTIVARATQLSGTDAGVIYEYDEQREVFVPRATEQLEAEIVETMLATPVRKGEGATGQLAEMQEPIQVPDILAAPAESRVRGALVRAGYRALLAVPLVRDDHLLGGLTVIRKATGAFAAEVIELLTTFATQSALAIQNARLFREIEEKSRQLEVASQHKSEFLANMSHELRTPLNAIIGFSEVLTDRMFGELNEKQNEYLKDIYASGTHLLSLINDILDLSKIEAGRMELELTDFDLPTALDNALTLVRERAGRGNITLRTSVDERLGEVQADERKIRQVVLNLLSNAIKFTPEGGRIDVVAAPKDGSVEVSVSDTGVGIAPADQEAVFEEFRQVGTAEKKAEGTGLGLTLCRKFVELHGGRIWVKSQVGTGSTFTFTIPVRRGE